MQQQNSYAGRYFIPNYDAFTFGSFILEKWAKKNWELQAGARYDYKSIATTRLKFNGDTFNYDFKFSTFASSLNVGYKPAQLHDFKINMSIALASRAPQVNELLSNGIHHGTATYEQGNINLQPERSFDIGTVIDFQNDEHNLSFNINLYRNQINGFIYQKPVPDSPVLTNAGAFPKLEYTQTDALLKGLDLAIMFKPFHQLEIASKYSMLRARDRINNDWIIYMPADRFQHSLTYTFKNTKSFENSYVSIDLQQVMNQSRVPSNKNGKQDYKDPPPAYHLLALHASTKIMLIKQPIIFGLGVKNLLNARYRDYLNQFRYFTDEMGRNISFKITLPIHK
jgi:iron complex outermembrane receptor protein